MIPVELIEKYGGVKLFLKKDEVLFIQGHPAYNYFQVCEGVIKMVNYNDDGTEFIQGIFKDGQSFGEPPLFGEFDYPSTAIAMERTSFYKLIKDHFYELLRDNFDIQIRFMQVLSNRLRYKSIILNELASHNPEHRITTLLDYIKKRTSSEGAKMKIPYTRQEIANMTGLRVETVIRTIKDLEESGRLEIRNRKVYY